MDQSLRPAPAPSLLALPIFYGGVVCIAAVLGNKQVALGPLSAFGTLLGVGPLAVEAGIAAFLLVVVVASAVAEIHGPVIANRMVRLGFLPLVTSVLLSLFVLALPASPSMDPARRDAFALMMGSTPRIWIGGLVAYGVSQTLNVTIFAGLKARRGGALWGRAAVAGVLSQIVDTLLFVTIAFAGIFPIGRLIVGQLIVKIVLSAVLVPPLVAMAVAIGRRLDHSDPQNPLP